MNTQKITTQSATRPKMLPMILSIAGNLLLWTLGFTTMSVATENIPQRVVQDDDAHRIVQDNAHKVVQEFPIDPARAENLQHWVDAGHDTWCRSANLVAQATLQRIAPEFSAEDRTLAALPIERKQLSRDKVIYTYHSFDGHTTYRITVVRHASRLHTADLKGSRVWLPIRSEKTITHAQEPLARYSGA
jgi:hypothetical protein